VFSCERIICIAGLKHERFGAAVRRPFGAEQRRAAEPVREEGKDAKNYIFQSVFHRYLCLNAAKIQYYFR
jgi:hypothetical protein